VVSLACQKAKDLGYPHELWTTRLLASHIRKHAAAAGHACLARISQGTVCKILNRHEVTPHKVRYYLERRDPAFEQKMAEVLCVYREVAVLRDSETASKAAIISYWPASLILSWIRESIGRYPMAEVIRGGGGDQREEVRGESDRGRTGAVAGPDPHRQALGAAIDEGADFVESGRVRCRRRVE
jgi:hypothetical protein